MLVDRVLGSGSRATDKQLSYVKQLLGTNHVLNNDVSHIDGKAAAARWIDAAKLKQP